MGFACPGEINVLLFPVFFHHFLGFGGPHHLFRQLGILQQLVEQFALGRRHFGGNLVQLAAVDFGFQRLGRSVQGFACLGQQPLQSGPFR